MNTNKHEAVKLETANHFKPLPAEESVMRIKAEFESAKKSIWQSLQEKSGADFETSMRLKIREQVARLIDVIAIHSSGLDECKEDVSVISASVEIFSTFLKDISNTYDLDGLSTTIDSALFHLHKDSELKISELTDMLS